MSAQLRSDIFVDSLRRHAETRGGVATLLRKGHPIGGMIHVVVRVSVRTSVVYSEGRDSDFRLEWQERLTDADDGMVADFVDRETRFDDDCWVLEVEGLSPAEVVAVRRDGAD